MKPRVVARRRPWRLLFGLLLLAILVAAGGWLVANMTDWALIRDRVAANPPQTDEWPPEPGAGGQVQRLREQLAVVRTERDMERQTVAELQEQIRILQGEVYSLTRELEFYRGIVSALRDADGLNVQALRVEPTSTAGQYRVILVLTRVAKNDSPAQGSARMILEGSRNGSRHTLRITELAGDSELAALDYHFKHFKRFEGFLDLPADFVPRRVTVQLLPEQGSHAKIERVFEWSEVTG